MVNQLGVPTLFLTLSAADLWWSCLARHFGISVEELNLLTEKQASQVMQEKLSENPLIADEYFSKRVCIFMDILKEKLKITDFWWRFEYQHRGSPHVHAVLWLENAPDVRTFDTASIDDLAVHKAYYDTIVSAYNPGIDAPRAEKHPSSVWATDIVLGDPIHFAQLLNRVQRHTQHSVYCLKDPSHPQECRFKFPKPKLLDSTLSRDEQGVWQYKSKRNDELLNDHNPFVSQLWRANTDCKIIASEHAIVNYISKYATKGEPQSQDFQTLFKEIMTSCTPNDHAKKAFTKMLTKVIGQRDISACEVMHLLTGDPLYHSSRQFVKLYISTDDYVAVANTSTDTDEFIQTSIMDHYAMRSATLEPMTLCEFATKHKIVRGRLINHRKSRVLQLRPVVKPGINEENDEIYYKQKLLMHIAWRNCEALKTHTTWKESFTSRNLSLWELPEIEDIDTDHVVLPEEDHHDWQELARTLPNQAPQDVILGYRDMDREYNGFGTYDKYPGLEENLDFIQKQKEIQVNITNDHSNNVLSPNEGQQKILDHLAQQLANESSEKLTLVQGGAGTGKSFIINKMVHMIESLHGSSSVILMAPTGVAANNINGQTIHNALHIVQTRGGTVSDLTGKAERQLQEDFRTVKVIICDEMSMVGTRMLSMIDKRLRQAFTNRQELPFGGCIVYFFGDFNQLPPVLDRTLLAPADPRKVSSIEGRFLFEQFKTVFELKQVMRQIGDDQNCFRETLKRMALGQLTLSDYELLKTRFSSNNVATVKSFTSAIRIKARKDAVHQYNQLMLRSSNKPVALIKAKHNNLTACGASEDEAQGLQATLQLSQGCRVILRQNIWTSQGLCNGSLGNVVDIVYGPNRSMDDFPICILVHFDGYEGPTFNGSLPILPLTVGYRKNNVSCTRRQFPLQVAYGITVHKAQGMTVDKAVVDIGTTEFALGLTYVAMSRVRSIEGLIIEPGFSQDRLLKCINNNAGWETKRRELARLRSLIQQ
ncbi:uncharacterized protein LOC128999172 [Macrosteles quadrilineatus]|uniref:uncharacterized protein LOC128987712 n=2 Tax=Macrosteles quadrilineatus TaxID=74068 RepID=UPI0023E3199A|nr:uncharacterized protein LOC128987712 [Macrosteles quadrilineatus]XP_054281547.1 uncharacterized protein LOC128999172 [Macrosteles quadrilineatus]